MKIYQLTQLGRRLARSTTNPDTDAWRVVHFLDRVVRATPDQVMEGARTADAAGILAILSRRGVTQEVGGGRVDF